ncbi:DUF2065 domain-containing protein [Kaistia granuli]|uniref:DUF2065 domain-containing protein n=1 Tax=Kaistia granuli TaxID=363259 RepID=UPI0003622E61|nr:DUF2065 domain-containing protein [Kaistia granuli]
MTDFVTALGLVLVIEGAFYAMAPTVAKTLMRQGIAASDSLLRGCGLIALAIGVAVVWLARN